MDKEDELIWDFALTRFYTPKLGYIILNEGLLNGDPFWWKKLWKLKFLAKAWLFIWCILKNNDPTWEVLQKISFEGPSWCSLCKNEGDFTLHLLLHCSFTRLAWKEATWLLDYNSIWQGNSIVIALHFSFTLTFYYYLRVTSRMLYIPACHKYFSIFLI